jgi:hypothetical protein
MSLVEGHSSSGRELMILATVEKVEDAEAGPATRVLRRTVRREGRAAGPRLMARFWREMGTVDALKVPRTVGVTWLGRLAVVGSDARERSGG